MDFKFNFSVGDSTVDKPSSAGNRPKQVSPDSRDECVSEAHENTCKSIKVQDIMKHWSSKASSYFYEVDQVSFSKDNAASLVVVTPSDTEEDKSTDLVPNVYEGGFKVWECTIDLLDYLAENNREEILKERTVLDLGCGVGLLGIFALILGGSSHVTFQDYNESVIVESTGPSSLANLFRHRCQEVRTRDGADELSPRTLAKRNIPSAANQENDAFDIEGILKDSRLVEIASDKIDFLAGDWSCLTKSTVLCRKFDIILSSETIYNSSYYSKLHDFLESFLSPDGVIYMSAKSHYFGVGGGVEAWFDFVAEKNVFDAETVLSIPAHLQRKILRMNFKTKN